MSQDAIVEEISKLPFFSILDEDELAELSDIMILLGMKPGQEILKEDDAGDACYFLIEGKVDIIKKIPGAEELLLDTLEAPTVFGELSLVTNQHRTASVVSRTGVRLIKLPKYPFHQMIMEGKIAAYKVIYRVATALGHRLASLDTEMLRVLKEAGTSFEEKLKIYQQAKGKTMQKWPF